MPTLCSNCADSERSRVTAVQPSSSSFTPGLPMLIIGSIVKNMPGLSSGPGPGRAAWTTPGAARMDHLRSVVEDAADAVAAEIADDAVAVLLGMDLDGVADVAEELART